jgi:hypothetical protein
MTVNLVGFFDFVELSLDSRVWDKRRWHISLGSGYGNGILWSVSYIMDISLMITHLISATAINFHLLSRHEQPYFKAL